LGILYIVPTPIGNLEDITLRALRVLKEVDLIAAEDTRTSGILLKHFDIDTRMMAYHEHNKMTRLDAIFDALAAGDVALISDAGTPGISDPGYELIREAVERGHRVEPLPGANAIVPALVGSGLPTDSFVYLGFLPKKKQSKLSLFSDLVNETHTVVVYESPNRLLDTLQSLLDVIGDRQICVARELSKKFEEFQRGTVSEVLSYYEAHPPKGEITLVIGGVGFINEAEEWDEARVRAALYMRMDGGESLTSAAKAIAQESGWQKRDIYALGVESM